PPQPRSPRENPARHGTPHHGNNHAQQHRHRRDADQPIGQPSTPHHRRAHSLQRPPQRKRQRQRQRHRRDRPQDRDAPSPRSLQHRDNHDHARRLHGLASQHQRANRHAAPAAKQNQPDRPHQRIAPRSPILRPRAFSPHRAS